MSVQLEESIKSINASISGVADQLKAHAEKTAATEKMTTEIKSQVDELLIKSSQLTNAQLTLEQAMAKIEGNGAGGDVQHISLGDQFASSESFKELQAKASQRGTAEIVVNAAITTFTTDADGSAGALVQPHRVPGIVTPPQRRLTMRDLLMPGKTSSHAIEYVRETGFTNNAAPVAETEEKPESSLKFDLMQTTTKVIAHYFKSSRQIMSDAPQLASLINGRGLQGLKLVEEAQILNGDGTGQNLLGIIPQATPYAAPAAVDAAAGTAGAKIDAIRLAMLQAVLAEYPASGIVLNPVDWAQIETAKDKEGRYLIGNPQGAINPTLWGLPIVQTQSMTAGNFLTGAFNLGAQLFDQWQARVEIATENDKDFVKNLITILIEERLALAVYRPESFIYGPFATAP